MRAFAVNRKETYEKTYFIRAESFNDAIEKLNDAFEVGDVFCPGMAEDAACYEEVSKDETAMFNEDYMMAHLDIGGE